jgi:hypothetical protein
MQVEQTVFRRICAGICAMAIIVELTMTYQLIHIDVQCEVETRKTQVVIMTLLLLLLVILLSPKEFRIT